MDHVHCNSATCNTEVQDNSVIYGDSVLSSMESTSVEASVLNWSRTLQTVSEIKWRRVPS